MPLHGKIMNIRAKTPSDLDKADGLVHAYRLGHRDARHAAAELALRADALADELREVLEWARVEKAPLREQEVASIRRALAEYEA
jgi:hypothetical protein